MRRKGEGKEEEKEKEKETEKEKEKEKEKVPGRRRYLVGEVERGRKKDISSKIFCHY